MLGVVLVAAAVDERDARRQVLGLVPGVGIHPPAAGGEHTRRENDRDQRQGRRFRNTRAGQRAQGSAPERVPQHNGLLAVGTG